MCNCPGCGWKIYTEFATNLACPKCEAGIECEGKTVPTDLPLNPAAWPLWAKQIAKRKRDGEIGVGDTVQRMASKVGGEAFKSVAKFLGIPCGCTERQSQWNSQYPYRTE